MYELSSTPLTRGEDKVEEGGGVLVESQTRSTKSKKKLKVEQDKVETEKKQSPSRVGETWGGRTVKG